MKIGTRVVVNCSCGGSTCDIQEKQGIIVEVSPSTARVKFPDDALFFKLSDIRIVDIEIFDQLGD